MLNNIILKLVNPSYAKAIKEAYSIQYLPKNQLLKLQENKFICLIEHCKKNIPFYSSILNNLSITNINELKNIPFLTKNIISQKFQELQATNLPRNRFNTNSTSGSTGDSTYFFSDKNTNVVRHACAHRGDSWTGWEFGKKTIMLWGAERDVKRTFISKLVNSGLLFNNTILSSFYMTDGDMLNYVALINRKKPELLVGYPSSLELLSNFINSRGLEVASPKGIITGGETLYQHQREIIESVFKTKALNRYGCREVGHIANECENQNGLHISSDHVIVEIINEKGETCLPGELGEIVVTDLDNFVFPFIRYRTGDLGIMSDRICSCGKPFPLLESVEGRTFDLVVGSNGNRVLATFFTIFLRNKIFGIKKFQLLQERIDKIVLFVVVDHYFSAEESNKIIATFKEKLGQETTVVIKVVDEIQQSAQSGKYRWIVSKVSPFNQKSE